MADLNNEHLFNCWKNGLGIRATMQSFKARFGQALSFEDVHRGFVDLSHRFA